MMEKVTLNVEGMSCGHCVKAVESSVGALNGVSNVVVDLEEKKVNVEFNQADVTLIKSKKRLMTKDTTLNNAVFESLLLKSKSRF